MKLRESNYLSENDFLTVDSLNGVFTIVGTNGIPFLTKGDKLAIQLEKIMLSDFDDIDNHYIAVIRDTHIDDKVKFFIPLFEVTKLNELDRMKTEVCFSLTFSNGSQVSLKGEEKKYQKLYELTLGFEQESINLPVEVKPVKRSGTLPFYDYSLVINKSPIATNVNHNHSVTANIE